MPTIVNPAPITVATFGAFWVASLALVARAGKPALLTASLAPTDGTHLLATGGKRVYLGDADAAAAKDAALASMLTHLRAQVRIDAGAAEADVLEIIQVAAPDPAQPVSALAIFKRPDGTENLLRIRDCFARAAQDAAFNAVLLETLGTVARLAGLTVS